MCPAGRVSWKEFLDIYAKQRAERAERFEETVVALTDKYKVRVSVCVCLPRCRRVVEMRGGYSPVCATSAW